MIQSRLDDPLEVRSDAGLGAGAQIRSDGIDFLLKTWMCTSLLLRLMMHLIQSRIIHDLAKLIFDTKYELNYIKRSSFEFYCKLCWTRTFNRAKVYGKSRIHLLPIFVEFRTDGDLEELYIHLGRSSNLSRCSQQLKIT